MASIADFLVKAKNVVTKGDPKDAPLGTGLANKAKDTIKNRTKYNQWVADDPERRSQYSFEEWMKGDLED